jgi:hypothetical protein
MASDDGDGRWTRELLTGLGALVAVALLIGLVVGLVTLGAVDVAGIGDRQAEATSAPSLYMPTAEPTTRPEPYPDPVGPSSSSSASPSPPAGEESPSPRPTKSKRPKGISLQAFPNTVAASERINLTGVYRAGEGATLQVQRFEGGWVDFPVNATVRGGIFATYVVTGRSGANRFRVLDPATGRASNPVSVTVG